jgi:hypothetical protein
MRRSPLLVATALLVGCHDGVPFALPDGQASLDGCAGCPADAAAGEDTPPGQDGPPGDVAAPAPGSDTAPAGVGDGAAPPSAACSPALPDPCPSGSARCGGTECVSLNTDQNCGRCGRTCGDSLCQAFDCRPVQVSGASGGALVAAANDTAAFWGTVGGELLRRGLGDGATTSLAANEGRFISLLADEKSLYVTSKEGLKCPQNACLWRLALDQGTREPLAELGNYTGGLTMDAEALYWFDHGAIVRFEKVGHARRELATGEGTDGGLAVDDQYVYWGSDAGGEGLIKRAAKDGKTPPRALVRGLSRPQGTAVDDLYVYWIDGGTRLVQMAPKEGGTAMTLASHLDPLQVPVTIAISTHDVYWGLMGGNSGLRRIPRCGGDLRIIEAGGIGSIFPWKGDIFWADYDRGLFRIAR